MAFWMLLACLIAAAAASGGLIAYSRLHVGHRSSNGWREALPSWFLGPIVRWIWMPVYRMTAGIQKSQQAASVGQV